MPVNSHALSRKRSSSMGAQVELPWQEAITRLTVLALVLGWLGPLYCMKGGHLEVISSPERIATSFFFEANWIGRLLIAAGAGCFTAAGVLSFARERRVLVDWSVAGLWALVACSVFWFCVIFDPYNIAQSLNITYTPLMWLMIWGMFIPFRTPIPAAAEYAALFVSVLSTGHALWLYRAEPAFSMAGGSPLYVSFVTAFWTLAFVVLSQNPRIQAMKGFLWIPLCALAFLAISMGMRGWSIQLLLLAIVLSLLSSARRAALYKVLGLVTALGVTLLLAHTNPDLFDYFRQRLGSDTRTHQYRDLFAQVDWWGLLKGYGPLGTYDTGQSQGYGYIDNQVLYILFKFGGVALAGYALTVIVPPLRLLFLPAHWRHRAPAVLGLLWLLAMGGLSTFHAVTMNTSNYVMILVAGQCNAMVRRLRLYPHHPAAVPLLPTRPRRRRA